jgi:hypothetical protein
MHRHERTGNGGQSRSERASHRRDDAGRYELSGHHQWSRGVVHDGKPTCISTAPDRQRHAVEREHGRDGRHGAQPFHGTGRDQDDRLPAGAGTTRASTETSAHPRATSDTITNPEPITHQEPIAKPEAIADRCPVAITNAHPEPVAHTGAVTNAVSDSYAVAIADAVTHAYPIAITDPGPHSIAHADSSTNADPAVPTNAVANSYPDGIAHAGDVADLVDQR